MRGECLVSYCSRPRKRRGYCDAHGRQTELKRIQPRKSPTPWTEERHLRALQMLQDGASYREVATTLGTDHRTVARRLPGYGWDRTEMGEYIALRTLENKL